MGWGSGVACGYAETLSDVACGYDVLGFAIDAPGDEVVVRHCAKPGLHITAITGDNGKLPKIAEKNTAVRAFCTDTSQLNMVAPGVRMVPSTTCRMEAYCETYRVCRQVPVCVPVCD